MSEIIVVNTEEKSLKFYDIYDNNNNNFCIVNVNVKYLYYNQDIHADPIRYYYDITYDYEYYENNRKIDNKSLSNLNNKTNIPSTNPFYHYMETMRDCNLDGVITMSNRVTSALVEQLMMDDEELQREVCNRWIVQYRAHLMYTLSTFWD